MVGHRFPLLQLLLLVCSYRSASLNITVSLKWFSPSEPCLSSYENGSIVRGRPDLETYFREKRGALLCFNSGGSGATTHIPNFGVSLRYKDPPGTNASKAYQPAVDSKIGIKILSQSRGDLDEILGITSDYSNLREEDVDEGDLEMRTSVSERSESLGMGMSLYSGDCSVYLNGLELNVCGNANPVKGGFRTNRVGGAWEVFRALRNEVALQAAGEEDGVDLAQIGKSSGSARAPLIVDVGRGMKGSLFYLSNPKKRPHPNAVGVVEGYMNILHPYNIPLVNDNVITVVLRVGRDYFGLMGLEVAARLIRNGGVRVGVVFADLDYLDDPSGGAQSDDEEAVPASDLGGKFYHCLASMKEIPRNTLGTFLIHVVTYRVQTLAEAGAIAAQMWGAKAAKAIEEVCGGEEEEDVDVHGWRENLETLRGKGFKGKEAFVNGKRIDLRSGPNAMLKSVSESVTEIHEKVLAMEVTDTHPKSYYAYILNRKGVRDRWDEWEAEEEVWNGNVGWVLSISGELGREVWNEFYKDNEENFNVIKGTKVTRSWVEGLPSQSSTERITDDAVGELPADFVSYNGRVLNLKGRPPLSSADLNMLVQSQSSLMSSVEDSLSASGLLTAGPRNSMDQQMIDRYTTNTGTFLSTDYPTKGNERTDVSLRIRQLVAATNSSNILYFRYPSPIPTPLNITAVVDPASWSGQSVLPMLSEVRKNMNVNLEILYTPKIATGLYDSRTVPVDNLYKYSSGGEVVFSNIPDDVVLSASIHSASNLEPSRSSGRWDADNLQCIKDDDAKGVCEDISIGYEVRNVVISGMFYESNGRPGVGTQLVLEDQFGGVVSDTVVMRNLGYWQLSAPRGGKYNITLKNNSWGSSVYEPFFHEVSLDEWDSDYILIMGERKPEMENAKIGDYAQDRSTSEASGKEKEERDEYEEGSGDVAQSETAEAPPAEAPPHGNALLRFFMSLFNRSRSAPAASTTPLTDEVPAAAPLASSSSADTINVFSLATGHLYERFLKIMMLSVTTKTSQPVKFWLLENYLSPAFKEEASQLAAEIGCQLEFVSYTWPSWLRQQVDRQRIIWGYKILFLDVLFPQSVNKIIFVDADQVLRGDLAELWNMDLQNHGGCATLHLHIPCSGFNS